MVGPNSKSIPNLTIEIPKEEVGTKRGRGYRPKINDWGLTSGQK
jgi:hypothetical protein